MLFLDDAQTLSTAQSCIFRTFFVPTEVLWPTWKIRIFHFLLVFLDPYEVPRFHTFTLTFVTRRVWVLSNGKLFKIKKKLSSYVVSNDSSKMSKFGRVGPAIGSKKCYSWGTANCFSHRILVITDFQQLLAHKYGSYLSNKKRFVKNGSQDEKVRGPSEWYRNGFLDRIVPRVFSALFRVISFCLKNMAIRRRPCSSSLTKWPSAAILDFSQLVEYNT